MKAFAVFLLVCLCWRLHAQSALDTVWQKAQLATSDTARLSMLLEGLRTHARNDAKKSIDLAKEGQKLAKKAKSPILFVEFQNVEAIAHYFMGNYDTAGQRFNAMLDSTLAKPLPEARAYACKGKGIIAYARGDYAKALDFYLKALHIQRQLNNESELAKLYNNIGLIYTNQQVYDKARSSFEEAIALYRKLGDQRNEGGSLNNIGNAYYREKRLDEALPYFQKSLQMREALKDVPGVALGYFNIGSIYFEKGDYAKAERYMKKSNQLREGLNDLRGLSLGYRRYGEILLKFNQRAKAKEYIEKGLALAMQIKAKLSVQESYALLSHVYKQEGDLAKAYQYLDWSAALKDSIYNDESGKEMARLQTLFETDKKERDIALLQKEKALQTLEIAKHQEEIRYTYTLLALGLVALLAIAYALYQKHLAHIALQQQKDLVEHERDRSDKLLLNILPKDVADELKADGAVRPKFYEQSTVMFTDFQGFSAYAHKYSPQIVLRKLDECFMAFDRIVEQYGIEKIKTIGDSYMCAAGLPVPAKDSAERMVMAALDMQAFMNEWNEKNASRGDLKWGLRVGIHTGNVIAGVIGTKKFAYDIWGDTVNTASRIESSDIAGEISISEQTYRCVRHLFACEYRGEVELKGVGNVGLYFVKGALGEQPIEEALAIHKPALDSEALQRCIESLLQVPIYKTADALAALQPLLHGGDEDLANWAKQVEETVIAYDEEAYHRLLQTAQAL